MKCVFMASLAVSTHSRPKAAAFFCVLEISTSPVSTHSRPKAAAKKGFSLAQLSQVSTHSRPKAAATEDLGARRLASGFNTQPPEGGCSLYKKMIKISKLFTVFRYPLKYKEYQEV